MRKNIFIIVGTLLCLVGIVVFYERPVISDDNPEEDLPMWNLPQDSTAELSPQVQHILGLYVAYISSMIDDSCFIIDLRVSRHSNRLVNLSVTHADELTFEEGYYCGASRYDGHVVRLWGENIHDFWTGTTPSIEVKWDTIYNDFIYSNDDRCIWWLCIDMVNHNICPSKCSFFCGFPYPDDTLTNLW